MTLLLLLLLLLGLQLCQCRLLMDRFGRGGFSRVKQLIIITVDLFTTSLQSGHHRFRPSSSNAKRCLWIATGWHWCRLFSTRTASRGSTVHASR
uniref:Putative secreted protein n=1 Tax=Anopheles darlingi TaxID=43151 RepID=A0A2M4DRQ1_ANODA